MTEHWSVWQHIGLCAKYNLPDPATSDASMWSISDPDSLEQLKQTALEKGLDAAYEEVEVQVLHFKRVVYYQYKPGATTFELKKWCVWERMGSNSQ